MYVKPYYIQSYRIHTTPCKKSLQFHTLGRRKEFQFQVAAIKKTKIEENLTLPPSFPQSFYLALNKAAQKAGMARATFAIKAIKFYSAALEKQNSPVTKALGPVSAESYTDQARKVSQNWWSKLSAAEKTARAKKAIEARWGKPKKK